MGNIVKDLKAGRLYPVFIEQRFSVAFSPYTPASFRFLHIQWIDYEQYGWGYRDEHKTMCGVLITSVLNSTWHVIPPEDYLPLLQVPRGLQAHQGSQRIHACP